MSRTSNDEPPSFDNVLQTHQIGAKNLLGEGERQVLQHQLLRLVVRLKHLGVYAGRILQRALRSELRRVDLRTVQDRKVGVKKKEGKIESLAHKKEKRKKKQSLWPLPCDGGTKADLGARQLGDRVGRGGGRVELQEAERVLRFDAAAQQRLAKKRLQCGSDVMCV